MEQKQITIEYQEYASMDELENGDRILAEKAIQATEGSWAPYSKFNVGAAVLMGNHEIVTGSNQENVASPSGLCAERVAIFAAHHKFPHERIESIAIAAKEEGKLTPFFIYPCSACVQVMAESQKRGGKPIRIIVVSASKIQIISSVSHLAPFSFGK